jgi:formate-dependent nitrite reductase membrane component NrfD
MIGELTWGLPVVFYLFLAGPGAGAVTVSAAVLPRGGGFGRSRFEVARYGALIGPLPTIIGTALIILELGAPFRVLNLFKVINLSPMSIGTWFLASFIVVSVAYAAAFLIPGRFTWAARLRTALAWVCLPFGIGVAVYTGVLLGAMPSRPLWNSPIIALLFLISALSAGTATIVLCMALFRRHSADEALESDFENSSFLLASSDAILLAAELGMIFLFIMFAYLTIGSTKEAIQVILAGGVLSIPFWGVAVTAGILIPFAIEIVLISPALLYGGKYRTHRAVEVAVPVLVLTGGFALRYVIVVAGQITGPAGL